MRTVPPGAEGWLEGGVEYSPGQDSILVKALRREMELVGDRGWSLEIYFWELAYVSAGARKSKIYWEGQQAAALQLELVLRLKADLLLPPRNSSSALRTSRLSSGLAC